MKNVIRSLPWKIFLFIMCILFLCVSVAGAVGAYAAEELGLYRYTQAQAEEKLRYEMVRQSAYEISTFTLMGRYTARDYGVYSTENTNLRFLITASDGTFFGSNLTDPPPRQGSDWQYWFTQRVDLGVDTQVECIFYAYLAPDLPVKDPYFFAIGLCRLCYALRFFVIPIAIAGLLLSILCWIGLLCVAGRRPRSEELHPGLLYRVPFDLLLFFCGVGMLLALYIADNLYGIGEVFCLGAIALGAVCLGLGLSMSIAVRMKGHTLITNTLLFRLFRLCCRLLKWLWRLLKAAGKQLLTLARGVPMIWRTLLTVAVLTFGDFLLFLETAEGVPTFLVWLLRSVLLAGIALYGALFMRKLQDGGRALAQGKLEHQVDTTMMFWDFKEHGENLNRISEGISTAVEQRLQSERMKTELITNVSHDIKTPLTSIINYATLIGQEHCGCEDHATYAEVLVRKSGHLKRLLDDLVEASKAATGNLEVQLTPCDAGVLLTQAAGEFEQRCQAAGLTLVTSMPEETVQIMADSRRIWRVFENLMGNACKYSLSGSRVFLTLTKEQSHAVFIIRNTSQTVLNISARELMERFVRGDSARSTEGSGLGLSIAQSLTQLQGGAMEVSVDGDLFRVTLRFPLYNQ